MSRLYYIHNIAMPGPEANTVNVAKMCDAFAANGCAVTLAALPGAEPQELAGRIRAHYGLKHAFEIAPLPRASRRPVLAAIAGVSMARRRGADLVYTRAPHVALAACLQGLPTVLEVHTDLSGFSPLGRAALKQAVAHPRLRGVVVISSALGQRLRRQIPGLRQAPIVAHDGADDPQAAPAPPLSTRFTVGYLGRLYRGRGLELIADLAARCPWADFQIVGGSAEDAARFIAAPPPNLRFLGAAPHAEVPRLLAAWHAVLAPYQRSVIVADGRTDTAAWMSPLKIFEYMAAGKAIVASDLPAIRDVLSDGETALLRPPDDLAAWIEALALLRDDPELRDRLAGNALELLRARYTWRERARTILDACEIAATAEAA